MKKKDTIFYVIVILYFFLVVFFFLYFFKSSEPKIVKVYNVQTPITSSQNIYAISLNEQIRQNLNSIKNAFFKYPGYKKLNISSVSNFAIVRKNNVSGSAPFCSQIFYQSKTKCTSLSDYYSLISPYINKLNVDFSSPHNINNYYIFKYQGNYYFMDTNYQKTIYNNGFPFYFIQG
jgi:hypothetical protein